MHGTWQPELPEQPAFSYLYNGKELDEELGLEWSFYGARMCDLAIGRFTGVDPLSDQRSWLSPYNYVQNNPLNRIDRTGALDDPIHDSKTGEFLGHYNDSDFDGEIMLMDASTYQMITGGEEVVLSPEYAEQFGTYLSDYVANEFNMDSRDDRVLLSNLFTSLIDQAYAEGLIDYNSSQLEGGKFKIGNDWGAAHYDRGLNGDEITINVHPVSLSQYQEGQFGGGTQSLFYLHHAGDAINILGVHEPLHRKYPGNGNHPIIDRLVQKNRAFKLASPDYQQHVISRIKKH